MFSIDCDLHIVTDHAGAAAEVARTASGCSALPGCEIHRAYLSAIEQSERNISIDNIATLRRD
jgi:hypothetical protein